MGLIPSQIQHLNIPIEEIDCSSADIKDVMKICNLKNKEITNVAHVNAWKIKMNGKDGRHICSEKNSWEFLAKIGEESMFGTTFLSQCDNKNKETFVFKIVSFPNEHSVKMFYNEIDFQHKASKLKVTSPVYQIFMDIHKKFGMFVMDRYQITVQRFFIVQLKSPHPDLKLLKRILDRCIEIDQLLQKHQIYHEDQHLNNFMLESIDDLDNIEKYVKIIDFGEARNAGDPLVMLKKIKVVDMPLFLPFENKGNISFFEYIKQLLSKIESSPPVETEFKQFLRSKYGADIIEYFNAMEEYIDFDGPHPKMIAKFKDQALREKYEKFIKYNEKKYKTYIIDEFKEKEEEGDEDEDEDDEEDDEEDD